MKSRGFTLVEMLIALVGGLLVLAVAIAGLRATQAGYARGVGSAEAEREARAVLSLLGDDLSRMVRREAISLEKQEGSRWPTDTLGFLLLQPEDAQAASERAGDLGAVSYRLRDIETRQGPLRCLTRRVRTSQDVFDALRGGADPASAAIFPPGESGESEEPLAFGVLGFDVELLSRKEAGVLESTGMPEEAEAVRVRLVVARKELADKMAAAGDWNDHPLLEDGAGAGRWFEAYEIVHPLGHED